MDTQKSTIQSRYFSLLGTKIEEAPRRDPEPEAYLQSRPSGVGNGRCLEDIRQSYAPSESGSSDKQQYEWPLPIDHEFHTVGSLEPRRTSSLATTSCL